MLKGNVGCGILAMGDAFKNGGLFLSPILTCIIGIICVYNQHVLVRNYYKIISFKKSISAFIVFIHDLNSDSEIRDLTIYKKSYFFSIM